jgi:hypothetical protein
VSPCPRHAGSRRSDRWAGERLPRSLRRTHRSFPTPMSAMQTGPHAGGYDLAAVALQVCTASHRLVMIRLLLLIRDRWAWQCQCNTEVLPVDGFLPGSAFDRSPLTDSRLNLLAPDRRLPSPWPFKNPPQLFPLTTSRPFNAHRRAVKPRFS